MQMTCIISFIFLFCLQQKYKLKQQQMEGESIQQQSKQQESLHSLKIQQQIQNNNQNSNTHNRKSSHQNNRSQNQSQQQDNSQNQQSNNQFQANYESLANLTSTQQLKKKITLSKKSQISNFIIKTYKILQDPINHQIIQWTQQGNAFIVKNKQKFENQILPKYFKHKKFSSFVRQLNMYDFHKIRKQKQIPIFKHKYFREGQIDLLHKIKRKSGEQGIGTTGMLEDEDNATVNNNMTKNYIPSLADLTQKPLISAYSFKSKSQIPFASMMNSQPSISLLPGSGNGSVCQLDRLLQQNQQLTNTISQLTHQQVSLQMQKQRKKQKCIKILNVLINFDLNQQKILSLNTDGSSIAYQKFQNNYSLRDLQNHFVSQEDPYSFSQYIECLSKIYKNVKRNIISMNGNQQDDQSKEERKIQVE